MVSKFTDDSYKETVAESKFAEGSWTQQLLAEQELKEKQVMEAKDPGLKISNLLQENGVPKAEAQETAQIIKSIQEQHKDNPAQRAKLTIDMAQGALTSAGVSVSDSRPIMGEVMTAAKKMDDTKPVQRQTQKMKM